MMEDTSQIILLPFACELQRTYLKNALFNWIKNSMELISFNLWYATSYDMQQSTHVKELSLLLIDCICRVSALF